MIPENCRFETFGEFYIKRDIISIWYDTIGLDKKFNYKYYIFSRPRRIDMLDDHCDMIWDWLNFNICDEELDKYYELWRFFNGN